VTSINPADNGERLLQHQKAISARLLTECHRLLMTGARGRDKHPGVIRRSQNWIGGTRPGNAAFVPAPPERVADLITNLGTDIHNPDDLPALSRIAIAHVQFETIHPYLERLPEHPVVSTPLVTTLLGTSKPTARKAIEQLVLSC
jgi:Fic family protein